MGNRHIRPVLFNKSNYTMYNLYRVWHLFFYQHWPLNTKQCICNVKIRVWMKMKFLSITKVLHYFFFFFLQTLTNICKDRMWLFTFLLFDNGKKNHLFTCMYTRICMHSGRIFVKEIHEDVLFNSRASIVLISKSFQKYVNH